MRRIIERLSRGIVLKRRLPASFSRLPIYVSPEASLRYWLPTSKADPMIYRMAQELVRPQDVVWDVGANVGLFAMSSAARTGPSGYVLAIEPDAWLCHLLQKSIRSAPSPMTVLCAAASDAATITKLVISGRSRAANHLVETGGSSQSARPREVQAVMTVTLDSLLDHFPPPTVLKIDVETHELKVLLGAKRLLRVARPRIWCEVSPESSPAVFELLKDFGYTMYAAAAPSPREPLVRCASWDTLAIPA